jgi:hypothetical protein
MMRRQRIRRRDHRNDHHERREKSDVCCNQIAGVKAAES